MRQSAVRSLLCASFACTMLFGCNQAGLAQAPADTPPTEVEFVQLSSPVYPPLARQARIIGDVKIHIKIRPDGSVASAEVIDGHPMLRQAALESAQKSTYECRGCQDPETSYSLTYTFGFRDDDGACREVIEERRVHAIKCLYVWRCGVRSTSTWSQDDRAPEVKQSAGHVTILASNACIETEAAR
jgi:TonB family protein